MSFGDNLRNRRKELGLTQEEIGKRIGCGKSTVNRYENGEINVPYDRILAAAKALETTPAYLMGWADDDPVDSESLKDDERILLKSYRSMTENDRDMMRDLARRLTHVD